MVMEKKSRRTSTIRNHSPSHDELTMARNGMATATVVVAQRLRDQSSQAMAVAGWGRGGGGSRAVLSQWTCESVGKRQSSRRTRD